MTLDQIVVKLRNSVRLQDPDIEQDPAYTYTDEDLEEILNLTAPIYTGDLDIESLPENELIFPILLARREIYFRLATSNAPYYPIEADGAKLQKNYRFDHYMKLIKLTLEEYQYLMSSGGIGGGVLNSFDVTIPSRHISFRNYQLSELPIVTLTVSGITTTTANLDWTQPSLKRAMFREFRIYLGTSALIDEYVERPLDNLTPVYTTYDFHQTKYRLTGLTPYTNYYAVVVSYDANGLFGYDQQAFRTLALS